MKRMIILLAVVVVPLLAGAQRPDCWEVFIQAIAEVESGNNELADDGKGCWGILQISSIYVKEVNRLYGTDYRHVDAFDATKSYEMFRLIQAAKNPQKDFQRALEIHNPRHSQAYAEKIYRTYNRLLKEKSLRNSIFLTESLIIK